ncbi:PAS domain S-box protein [Rosettibacter firmus]|uniref:PAS domain S-box protein n=1 Tax=Rosettibacter firmus TaxID=3111522 RepID=UPI00336BEDFD
MTEEIRNSKTNSKTQVELFNLIIDKSGKIVAISPAVKKIIPEAAPQKNLFELFNEDEIISLQRIFLDARKYETTGRDYVELKFENEKKTYEFVISPLRSENNVYFYIDILPVEIAESKQRVEKFIIATSEIEKLSSNKKIHSIIDKIKITFPFTFIEKAKIQKEINELDEFFWIKEPSGKFILVNETYASALGFTSSQLENKKEEDFLPKYLIPLYQTINNYIKETSNAVIVEGNVTPIAGRLEKNINIIQFPICDLDNKVVAIIGFSQREERKVAEGESLINNIALKNLPVPFLFLSPENIILAYSNKLLPLLNITDVINKSIIQVLPKNIVEIINKYTFDINQRDTIKFNFDLSKDIVFEITAQKVYDQSKFLGTIILFMKKELNESLLNQQNNFYDQIIQNIPEAIYIYDLENLKFLEVNDAALKLYGYKRNEFLNMDLTDLFSPEDIQTLIQSSDSKSFINLNGPWRHKRSDGSFIIVNTNRISIEYKNKKAHLNIITDITKEAEEKVKLQLYQNAYENTSDLIIITDKDGFIIDINDNVSKKLGFSKKDLGARPLISLVSDEERAKVNKNVFHSNTFKKVTLEVNLKKQTGDYQKAILISTPIKNYQGEIESYLVILKLQEEKLSHEQLDDIKKEVTGIDSTFLSSMFHELLTPLNVILGFTQDLWESIENPTSEQKEAVEIIKENQKLLMQIMDNAVDYASLLQKSVKLKPEHVKIDDILDQIKNNIYKEIEIAKKEIIYDKIDSNIIFETDKQKFITLLGLILKFVISITKENSLYLSAYQRSSDNIIISFRDNKNSISPLLLKGINEIFSEEESVSRRNYGFSKFSVRLTKKLIELLSIKKETIKKDNLDYEFALVIPIKYVMQKDLNIEIEEVKKEELKQQKAQVEEQADKFKEKELDLTQLSCLYLEDQIDSQILFKSQMKELKSVEVAPSLEAALPLLKTKRFDFLVIDINLQGEYNGLDALRIIQKIPGYKNVPMIASTAYMQPGAREDFIAAGFTDFISKPLLKEKIVEILKRIYK